MYAHTPPKEPGVTIPTVGTGAPAENVPPAMPFQPDRPGTSPFLFAENYWLNTNM